MRRIAFVAVVVAVLIGASWLLATRDSTQAGGSATEAIEPPPVTEIAPAQSRPTPDEAAPSAMQGITASLVRRGAPTDTAPKPREPVPSVAQSAPTSTPIPIDVSEGFEALLSPPIDLPDTNPGSAIVRRHRQLVSEGRDEAWAGRVEPDIQAYIEMALAEQGLDPRRIKLSVLECRTTGCEIQASAARMEDGMKPPQQLLDQMIRGPFARDFDPREMTVIVTTLPDGRHGYLAFLPRKQP